MWKTYKLSVILILLLNFLTACQSVREGFEGKKKSQSAEEFLIEKKNPLVLPPDFSKLPIPKSETTSISENEFDLESIIKENTNNKKSPKIKSSSSIEKSILEKIKNN